MRIVMCKKNNTLPGHIKALYGQSRLHEMMVVVILAPIEYSSMISGDIRPHSHHVFATLRADTFVWAKKVFRGKRRRIHRLSWGKCSAKVQTIDYLCRVYVFFV